MAAESLTLTFMIIHFAICTSMMVSTYEQPHYGLSLYLAHLVYGVFIIFVKVSGHRNYW